MEKIYKNVNLLYIIHGDNILMRKFTHQDYEVIDVFAFKNGNDLNADISNKLSNLFGKTFPYTYYGKIESVINKENMTVSLAIKTYKVILNEKTTVLESYNDDVIKNGSEIIWVSKDEIKNEKRLREGDKKILERVFDNRNIDIKIIEDQGEKWIDAKTLVFEDR